MTGQVEILVLRSGHADALMQMFEEISRDVASVHFHPHPFDAEWTERIWRHQGKDLYFGLLHDGAMVGYGMLRGWDDGYDVPSLGIFLSSKVRGTASECFARQESKLATLMCGAVTGVVRLAGPHSPIREGNNPVGDVLPALRFTPLAATCSHP